MSAFRISTALWLAVITLCLSSCGKDDDVQEEVLPRADFTLAYEADLTSIMAHVGYTEQSGVSERGLLWGDSPGGSAPENQKQKATFGNNPYEVAITGLTPGKVYYIRPYLIINRREVRGSEIAVNLDKPKADFTLTYQADLSSITVHVSYARRVGELSEQGILWGDTPELSISSSQKKRAAEGSSFDVVLTGLTAGKVYHIRPYAILNDQEFLGEEISIKLESPKATFIVTYETDISVMTVHVRYSELVGVMAEQGLLWGDTPGLSVATSQKEKMPSGQGPDYYVQLSGLTGGKTYYIKPYVILSGQEFTGEEMVITPPKPTYATVAPLTAGRGQRVRITGSFFTTDAAAVSVLAGGLQATVVSMSATALEFLVPEGAVPGASLDISAKVLGYDLGVTERVMVSAWSVLQDVPSGFDVAPLYWSSGDFFLKGAAYRMFPARPTRRYTPETDSWEDLPVNYDFPAPVKGTGIHEPLYFTIGGHGYMGVTARFNDADIGTADKGLYAFDPDGVSWVRKADFPGTLHKVGYAGGSVVNGSKLYFVATGTTTDFWEYDATADRWTQRADFPGPPTRNLSAFAIGDYVYFGAGTRPAFNADFYAYHTVSDTWTQVASLPRQPGPSGNVFYETKPAFAMGRRAYLMAGNEIWIYDADSDHWSLHHERIPGSSLRQGPALYVNGDYILFGGGVEDHPESNKMIELNDFYRWYPQE